MILPALALGLATYYVATVLSEGEVFDDFRRWATGAPRWLLPLRAMSCHLCCSFWVALAGTVVLQLESPVEAPVLTWMTAAGVSTALRDWLVGRG